MQVLKRALHILFIFSRSLVSSSQSACGLVDEAFQSGEELNYKVNYNWGLIWLESAHASFTIKATIQNGRKCFRFNGSGSTYPKYDWFFKVRDKFETIVDSQNFTPVKFMADIYEGSKR